uniref:Abi family protein n=2 Tax=Enterobacterales TaxID=91347 RepID=UPI00137ADFCF
MSRKPVPKVAFTKPPTSFSDQIRLLQQRGLVISDGPKAEFYLAQLNYYRFAAYCLPYEQDHASHAFIAGTQFEQILNLYVFDRELRLLVLDAIERFEVSLHTQIAYQLSQKYQTAHPHLKPELFGDLLEYASSLGKLTGEVKRSREEFIK